MFRIRKYPSTDVAILFKGLARQFVGQTNVRQWATALTRCQRRKRKPLAKCLNGIAMRTARATGFDSVGSKLTAEHRFCAATVTFAMPSCALAFATGITCYEQTPIAIASFIDKPWIKPSKIVEQGIRGNP
jgi:hypothetical protein